MKTEQIIILIVSFFLGMLLLNMVKNVCGCGVKEGFVAGGDSGSDNFVDNLLQSCIDNANTRSGVVSNLRSKMAEGSKCGSEPVPGLESLYPDVHDPIEFSITKLQEELAAGRCVDARDIITSNCGCDDNLNNLTEDGRCPRRGADGGGGGGGETVDLCAPNPCHNGGECTILSMLGSRTAQCTCATGFTGTYCGEAAVVPPDLCAPNPCLNDGVCSIVKMLGSRTAQCECAAGFTGTHCDEELLPCTGDAEQIKEKCLCEGEHGMGEQCDAGKYCWAWHPEQIKPATTGAFDAAYTTCQASDPCFMRTGEGFSQCQNLGRCVADSTKFPEHIWGCNCTAGWEGNNCMDQDISVADYCETQENCAENQICKNNTCTEPAPAAHVNEGQPNCPRPCLNGGTCVEGQFGWQCSCLEQSPSQRTSDCGCLAGYGPTTSGGCEKCGANQYSPDGFCNGICEPPKVIKNPHTKDASCELADGGWDAIHALGPLSTCRDGFELYAKYIRTGMEGRGCSRSPTLLDLQNVRDIKTVTDLDTVLADKCCITTTGSNPGCDPHRYCQPLYHKSKNCVSDPVTGNQVLECMKLADDAPDGYYLEEGRGGVTRVNKCSPALDGEPVSSCSDINVDGISTLACNGVPCQVGGDSGECVMTQVMGGYQGLATSECKINEETAAAATSSPEHGQPYCDTPNTAPPCTVKHEANTIFSTPEVECTNDIREDCCCPDPNPSCFGSVPTDGLSPRPNSSCNLAEHFEWRCGVGGYQISMNNLCCDLTIESQPVWKACNPADDTETSTVCGGVATGEVVPNANISNMMGLPCGGGNIDLNDADPSCGPGGGVPGGGRGWGWSEDTVLLR